MIPRIAPLIQETFTAHGFLDPDLDELSEGKAREWVEFQVVGRLLDLAHERGFLESIENLDIPVRWKDNVATATLRAARIDNSTGEWPKLDDIYWESP